MIQTPSKGTTKTERQSHASKTDTHSRPPIADQPSHVDFQTDQEQKQHQAEIGDQVEIRDGFLRENGIGESRDAAHDGRA